MGISRKQGLAIAAIVAAGIVATGAVLVGGQRGTAAAEHAHEHEQEHEHDDEHGHGHGEKQGHGHEEKQGHGHEHGHGHEAQPAGGPRIVKLDAGQVAAAAIGVDTAGPGTLRAARDFPGEIRLNEDRTAHVVPRLAGVAESVAANLGQPVRRGQVLAVLASATISEQRTDHLAAESRLAAARRTLERERQLWQDRISAEQDYLQAQAAVREAEIAVANARQKLAAVGALGKASGLNRFELRAPFDGTVVDKHLALGESVKEDASVFTISDLDSVWAEFPVGAKDLDLVRVGQRVVVSSTASHQRAQGIVSYVGALLGEQTRTARARVVLANPQGAWRPGLFVTVGVLAADQPVPVSVPAEAVQTIDDQATVFRSVPGGFQPMPVRPGRSDGERVEILGGLQAGERVATRNAFVLKAELGKGSAEHTH